MLRSKTEDCVLTPERTNVMRGSSIRAGFFQSAKMPPKQSRPSIKDPTPSVC